MSHDPATNDVLKMQDALKEAEVAFASSQTSKSSKPLDPAPFAVGFSYGWNDAQDSSIPARNTKVQERTAEFAETNGHEHEGEFNTGYSKGWHTRKHSK